MSGKKKKNGWKPPFVATTFVVECERGDLLVVATNRGGQGAKIPDALRLLLVILLVFPAGSTQTGEPAGRDSDRAHVPVAVRLAVRRAGASHLVESVDRSAGEDHSRQQRNFQKQQQQQQQSLHSLFIILAAGQHPLCALCEAPPEMPPSRLGGIVHSRKTHHRLADQALATTGRKHEGVMTRATMTRMDYAHTSILFFNTHLLRLTSPSSARPFSSLFLDGT